MANDTHTPHTRAVIQRLGLDGHLINMTVTETFNPFYIV